MKDIENSAENLEVTEVIENTEVASEVIESQGAFDKGLEASKESVTPEEKPEVIEEPKVEEVKVEEPKIDEKPRKSKSKLEPKVEPKPEPKPVIKSKDYDSKAILRSLRSAEVYDDIYEAVRLYKTNNYKVIKGNNEYPTFMVIVAKGKTHYCISRLSAIKFNIHE